MRRIARWFSGLLRWVATLGVVAVTAFAVLLIWQYYVAAPWTRDGRVRALVANVAPQVSGQITEMRIVDNQIVHKGDVLYVIDPFDFKVKLRSAQAMMKMRVSDMQVKKVQNERRQALTSLSTSVEQKQQYAGTAVMADAQVDDALAQADQAEINLKRTEVRSPVDGYVTNLQLRVGDYATTGSANVAIVDMHSFWVDGYFEETKLARICVGADARVELMGFAEPISGRVASLGRGISVSDATSSTQSLPNVDPVYTWVRLAQRVPVRIELVDVPAGIPLASGLTATVRIRSADHDDWRTGLHETVRDALASIHLQPAARRSCRLPDNGLIGATSSLPLDEARIRPSSERINPGLAPSMDQPPNLDEVDYPRKRDAPTRRDATPTKSTEW